MFFEFFKKLETKTLLIAAGFLVLTGVLGFSFWFYFNFLKSDNFLEAVPAEAAIYWQSDFSGGADEAWLWAMGRTALSRDAAQQIKFLEEVVAPEAGRLGFAILPDFSDFIFIGQMTDESFYSLKNRLEELNYHYIFGDKKRVIISNSRFGLEKAAAVLGHEKKSLADDKMKLFSFNKAKRHSSSQIYFGENFKIGDFRAMLWFSDFWSNNKLVVAPKGERESPQNLADFSFLAVSDDKYLKNGMEEIIKDDLSVLFPEVQDKTLPDGTKVKELLANPDIFVFQNEEILGMPVHYLSAGALNQEFLVGREGQRVIFSDSTESLQDFLVNTRRKPDYYGKSLGELIMDCLKSVTPDFSGIIFEINL